MSGEIVGQVLTFAFLAVVWIWMLYCAWSNPCPIPCRHRRCAHLLSGNRD